jgi:hypothetical protein
MNKRQLIDDIRQHNPTATEHFLVQFDEAALKQYLEHLEAAKAKHARKLSWMRPSPNLRMVS